MSSSITIHHNPDCGTSRNTFALIRNSGEEPKVVECLQASPGRAELVELLGARLCRPSEVAMDILSSPQRGPFTKEDGEQVIDAEGRRVAH